MLGCARQAAMIQIRDWITLGSLRLRCEASQSAQPGEEALGLTEGHFDVWYLHNHSKMSSCECEAAMHRVTHLGIGKNRGRSVGVRGGVGMGMLGKCTAANIAGMPRVGRAFWFPQLLLSFANSLGHGRGIWRLHTHVCKLCKLYHSPVQCTKYMVSSAVAVQ